MPRCLEPGSTARPCSCPNRFPNTRPRRTPRPPLTPGPLSLPAGRRRPPLEPRAAGRSAGCRSRPVGPRPIVAPSRTSPGPDRCPDGAGRFRRARLLTREFAPGIVTHETTWFRRCVAPRLRPADPVRAGRTLLAHLLLLRLALVGGENPVDEVRRDLLVVAGLDVKVGASAGDGAQVASIGEHLDLGHLGLY